jgi:hypothetical protein
LAVIVSEYCEKINTLKMEIIKKYGLIIVILFAFFMFYKPICCFLILGIVIFYYGVNSLTFLNHIKKNGIESLGEILSYESDKDGYKTPIIEFKTQKGELIKQKPYYYASTDLSFFRTYKNNINKKNAVIYSEENPEKFVIKTEKNFNIGSIILMIIVGLFFLGLSIGNLLGFLNMGI